LNIVRVYTIKIRLTEAQIINRIE